MHTTNNFCMQSIIIKTCCKTGNWKMLHFFDTGVSVISCEKQRDADLWMKANFRGYDML